MTETERRKGVILVLTGASGVGKDEAMRVLKERLGCSQVLTTTDREKRLGEINGVHYDFVTTEKFNRRVEDGEFLEHVEYRGTNKGTPKSEINKVLGSGDIIIWRIDPSAAANAVSIVQGEFPDVGGEIAKRMVTVYISGDWKDIRRRYFAREPGADRKIFDNNLRKDKRMWKRNRDRYDFVVRNPQGKLEETVDTVVMILRTARGEILSPPRV